MIKHFSKEDIQMANRYMQIKTTMRYHLTPLKMAITKSSVQFSPSVVSNCLWPHELQHTRPPCPSPTPRVHPNLCPLSQWCHPTISSSATLFSSCPQSFPVSGSFPVNQLFISGGRNIGTSVSTSVFSMNIKGWAWALVFFRATIQQIKQPNYHRLWEPKGVSSQKGLTHPLRWW